MSSSPDARVFRDASATAVLGPELRSGTWTRFGAATVLGDAVTEDALSALAASTRTAAQAQGYAVGWAEGRRAAAQEAAHVAQQQAELAADAEARREAEHAAALHRLEAATRALEDAVAGAARAVEDRALTLARELTTLLVGHELRCTPDSGSDAVRRALVLVAAEPACRVRLHPLDAGSDAAAALTAQGLQVVPDAALDAGDVVVETDGGVLDGRVSAALARVRDVLTDAAGGAA